MVKTSAPGKMMFFGEHAAVYGIPCIAFAVNQRLYCSINKRKDKRIIFNFPDIGLMDYEYTGSSEDKRVKFIEAAIKNTVGDKISDFGFEVETRSEMKKGVGTSSACVVAMVAALNEFFKLGLNREQMFGICYKTVLDVQGKGSGYDVATSLYGGFVKYTKGQLPIPMDCPAKLHLVMGHTNIKADTVSLINQVAEKKQKFPHFYEEIFRLTENCVLEAENRIKIGDLEGLADMMNFVHGILNGMGVSHPKLEELIFASRNAGALGAKLSGAGGGDCMIALASDTTVKAIMAEIEKKGGAPFEVRVDEGVRIEDI
jgi:mevalonate kinase